MKIARKKMRVEIPSVAMGDIAFNLLIFFFILARGQDDSHIKWEPASTDKVENVGHAQVRVAAAFQPPENNLKVYLNGQERGVGQLAAEIEKILGDAPAGKRTVLLKIDKNVIAQIYEPIIEAVSQAGGEMVHVLEEKKEGQ